MEQIASEISCGLRARSAHIARSAIAPSASPLSQSSLAALPGSSMQSVVSSSSTALLNADNSKILTTPLLTIPPSRSLFPSSLKFLWFGGDDSCSSRSNKDGYADADSSADQPCTCFTDADESDSHAVTVPYSESSPDLNVEHSDEADIQPMPMEVEPSVVQEKPDGTAETPKSFVESSWISRILQIRLNVWRTANPDQLPDSRDRIASAPSDDGKKGKRISMNYTDKCSEMLSDIDVSMKQNAATDSRSNQNGKKPDHLHHCLCMLETRERLAHDRESLSMFIHEVPVQEVTSISKLCLLSNLAYIIPEVQSKDLLRDHHLTFVTSSLAKKEQAEAHASSERAVPKQKFGPNRKQDFPGDATNAASNRASNFQALDRTRSSSGGISHFDKALELAATNHVSNMQKRDSNIDEAPNRTSSEAITLKAHDRCPCEWFICDDHATNTRYLVIQGSESLASWQTNLTFDPTKFEGMAGVLVHRGVYEAAQGLYELVARELVEHVRKGSRARLSMTGHSLGGSLATLIAILLVKRGAVDASAVEAVVTLGSPCVFLCSGERLLRHLRLQVHRFVNVVMHRDIVPRAFACDYPLNAVRILRRLHGTFRDHPCLHFQNVLYAPIGRMMILQPSEMQSPGHPLLPRRAGLYLIGHPEAGARQSLQQEAFLGVMEAQRAFLNTPHPLDVLKDLGAYGFRGAISRDHDPRSYRQAINTILALGLRRQSRRRHLPASSRRHPRRPSLAPSSSSSNFKRHPLIRSHHFQVALLLILSMSSLGIARLSLLILPL